VKERQTLSEKIATVLQSKLEYSATVISGDGNIWITISPEDFQENLGILYRETSELVHQYFPRRDEDIRLFFTDTNGLQRATFRLWHSAAA